MESENTSLPKTSLEPTPPDKQIKDWALYTHLSGLCFLIGLPSILGPLIIWLVQKDKIPRVDSEGKNAINFHLTMLIVQIISIPLAFILIGFITMFGAVIMTIICPIMASIATSNGTPYSYPLSYRFLT